MDSSYSWMGVALSLFLITKSYKVRPHSKSSSTFPTKYYIGPNSIISSDRWKLYCGDL